MHKLTDSELIEELKARFEENTRTLDALKRVHEKIVEVNLSAEEKNALHTSAEIVKENISKLGV